MNILFINSDAAMHDEFAEFSLAMNAHDFYAQSQEESITILNDHKIDMVILKIAKLSDAAILKYIHDYYKDIKVLVSAREDVEEALAIFNQVNYEKLKSPVGLKDIKGHMVH